MELRGLPDHPKPCVRADAVGKVFVYYRAHPRDNRAVTVRLKELAAVRVRYGYRRLTILMRREG